MDRYQLKRVYVALAITIVGCGAFFGIATLRGMHATSILQFWPMAPSLFGLILLCVEFSGKLRSPLEKYDRAIDDEWDR